MTGSPPIVDAHLHLWSPGRLTYPWLRRTSLDRPFLPGDLDTGRHTVSRFVAVQAGCLPGQSAAEVSFVRDLARTFPRLRGLVAHARLEAGLAAGPRIRELGSDPFVVGVRRLLQDDPGLAASEGFVTGVRLLADHDLPLDACIRYQQLGEIARLAGQCPEIVIVLDHLGKPEHDPSALKAWSAGLAEVAARPNTVCKLSGLVTERGFAGATADTVRPALLTAVDTFGPQRCLFGSDWPVLTEVSAYERWADLVLDAISDLPPEQQAAILGGTATRVYRLDRTEPTG